MGAQSAAPSRTTSVAKSRLVGAHGAASGGRKRVANGTVEKTESEPKRLAVDPKLRGDKCVCAVCKKSPKELVTSYSI